MFTDVCCLATVRKQKTRISVAQPAELNCMAAEGTNVSEEGFNPSESKKYTAQAPPAMVFVAYQVFESIVRVESFQYRVVIPALSVETMRRERWSYLARLYTPKPALSSNHTMTIGEKTMVSFDMPSGCTTNNRIRIAQVTPMIVDLSMSGLTTLSPWTAPSTDWAGVKTPSAMTMETESTPIVFRRPRKNLEFSIPDRMFLVERPKSLVSCLCIPTTVSIGRVFERGLTYGRAIPREDLGWRCLPEPYQHTSGALETAGILTYLDNSE